MPAFWQMMWEQRACVIAMVTNEIEGGKVREGKRNKKNNERLMNYRYKLLLSSVLAFLLDSPEQGCI